MDPVQRVVSLWERRCADWSEAEFAQAMARARDRWLDASGRFGVRYPMVTDVVTQIAPEFRLPAEVEAACRAARIPTSRNASSEIAVAFVKWEACPLTRAHPNPYEPLIEIWEHGGHFSMEHRIFVDFYDAQGRHVGGVVHRHPDDPIVRHPGRKLQAERRGGRRSRRHSKE